MQKLDLSGLWRVYLDAEKRETPPTAFPDEMPLPGTTSQAGLGPENPARETYFLTDTHRFEGYAWFQRTFQAGDWADCYVLLTLERTRKTDVWLDGEPLGHQDSLCTPHEYLLPHGLTAGTHILLVRVDNTDYPTRGGHLTSPDTQSNWNGVTGEISLTVAHALARHLRVTTDWLRCALRVQGEILGGNGLVSIELPGQMEHIFPCKDRVLDALCPLRGDEALWDEFHPIVHTLRLDVDGSIYEIPFGLRKFAAKERRLYCNGQEAFLRGKHDGLAFPLTGAAPTDVPAWRKTLQTAKDYGINHYRFHTCCPPEAAFVAADELGVYLEPELPFWGTVAEAGEEGYDAAERAFLAEEGRRILIAFGHHPSFVMLSLGNELWGSKRVMNELLAEYRRLDPEKLYVSGSNNFQWVPEVLKEEDVFVGVRLGRNRLLRGSYAMCDAPQGLVQRTAPESVSSFDGAVVPPVEEKGTEGGKVLIQYGTGVREVDADAAEALIPRVPIISHEVGQYVFYPDFNEIPRYTGPLKPRNLEVFRERLQAAGLWDDHERFFRAVGHLAVSCYRREVETQLRSRELSGFQLLDLQDFPGQGTALVGVLNALMESKGLISPEQWRRFCAPTVVLGGFPRFYLESGEPLNFTVMASQCQPGYRASRVRCTLLEGDTVLAEQEAVLTRVESRLSDAVSVTFGPVEAEQTRRLTVRLTLEDLAVNEYELWVFPQLAVDITRQGIRWQGRWLPFAAEGEEAAGPALVIPSAQGKLPAEYCTDFWCYPMFRSISQSMGKPEPVGTLGLCVDVAHPLLRRFAPEEWTTPPWYPILSTAHVEPLPAQISPVVQMVDNTERCQRLGLLYQREGRWYLTARLWENAQDPAVRTFAASLAEALPCV